MKYHCKSSFRSVMMTKDPLLSARELPENPALNQARLEADERAFLARGAAAGAKVRETGVSVSAAESIARLKTLAAQRAGTSKP
jgi:hypothetical protein